MGAGELRDGASAVIGQVVSRLPVGKVICKKLLNTLEPIIESHQPG